MYVDMHAPLETVPVGDAKPVHLEPNRRYWPNPVSLEYCARIDNADGTSDEHWYDDEGKALDKDSPEIRNIRRVNKLDLCDAFMAGAGDDTPEIRERFNAWLTRWSARTAK